MNRVLGAAARRVLGEPGSRSRRDFVARARRASRASLVGGLLVVSACVSFAPREERIAADPAPVTDIAVEAGDTTYVLRADGYWLLATRRDALWRRDVLDEVVWRWRQVYGSAPAAVAVRFDLVESRRTRNTVDVVRDSVGSWRGMPLLRADVVGGRSLRGWQQPSAALAARLASLWLRSTANNDVPDWLEAGTAVSLAGAEVAERIGTWRERRGMTASELIAASWPTERSIADVLRMREDTLLDAAYAHRISSRGTRPSVSGADAERGREFAAQSASLLAYLRERDPAVVAQLARGTALIAAVAESTTIPHDLEALDAAWRKWVKERPGRMRRS